jgi:DNA recombination protein Rad52
MGFSRKQLGALKRHLEPRVIRTREAHGRQFSYLEGWYVIAEANRIFGYNGWSRETLETKCVLGRESRGTFRAIYIARVRITVQANGATIIREGHGSGEGHGTSAAEVHDIAVKAAETDATKRALATFGKPFGLELYRHDRATAAAAALAPTAAAAERAHTAIGLTEPDPAAALAALKHPVIPPTRLGFHPDDTTPIPRPSRYYGRRQGAAISERVGNQRRSLPARSVAPPLAPAGPGLLSGDSAAHAKVDKSALALPEPKRLRDKNHLKFVAEQPCLVCGRQPCDPHHLRFAQARAIGMKVSDEFTVPLCRGHHRQLHQAGNEAVWWENLKINALEIAQGLWEQTHPDLASAVLDRTGASKARAPESNDAMTAAGGKSQNRSAAGNTDDQAPSDGERE